MTQTTEIYSIENARHGYRVEHSDSELAIVIPSETLIEYIQETQLNYVGDECIKPDVYLTDNYYDVICKYLNDWP